MAEDSTTISPSPGAPAGAQGSDSQFANVAFAADGQMDVRFPSSWEQHHNDALDLGKLGLESRVRTVKDRLSVNRADLPIEVKVEGDNKVLYLPTNFYDTPHDLKLIIGLCANRLQFKVKLERSRISLEDPENEILLGILVGLSDKEFSKIKPDTKSQLEIGRNICNWERRLAYCYAKELDVNCLHVINKYAGDSKQVKLLTKVIRDCCPKDLRQEKKIVWDKCTEQIELLIKHYFRYLIKYQGKQFAAPVDIFKTFDETWAFHALTKTDTATTIRKVRGREKPVTKSKVTRYHPKKPSNLVGILDSEQELIKGFLDKPWEKVNEIKTNWSNLLKTQKWEWINSQLRELSEQQSYYYNFARKAMNPRIRQCDLKNIPNRDQFRKWLLSHNTKEKQGKITVSYFSPLVLLDEKLYLKFSSLVLPSVTYKNAISGQFDTLKGFMTAFEWYKKFFNLEEQVKEPHIERAPRARPPPKPPDTHALTNQFEQLNVKAGMPEDIKRDLFVPQASKAQPPAKKQNGRSISDLSASIEKQKRKGDDRSRR